ncbi:hypothetical protein I4U23_004111 [Adineta vaga]|nr:hypothetical protein I4U23_004111 [Adineta vaga]
MFSHCLVVLLGICFASVDARKVGCFSYERTGQVVAGGNDIGSGLNQFFTDRFYVDDAKNLYLLDRSASATCERRFLLWPVNSSQANLITSACINGVPSLLQDVLVSPNGKTKITGYSVNNDVVSQVRRVDGQNGFMLWSATIVDNDKNIYSYGYSTNSQSYELRKWTSFGNGPSNGILIAAKQSFSDISDFFVGNDGSVYSVGPDDTAIRKWTNGVTTYLTRNTKLNHPTTLFVDDEENIYIGEFNKITLWPTKSNDSFPVININQTNGLVLGINYKNVIQMDNDGSLYVLSTDRAVFGTTIFKYQCNNCATCIKDNPFTAVSYKGAYGPLYSGNIKLSNYSKWSALINAGQATKTEKVIVSSMANNEGNLDSVQSYDPAIVTAGAMQKIIGNTGGGEFEKQVYEFKQEHPQVYNEKFEKCGWSVSSTKQMSFRGKTGSTLKQYLRQNFQKGSVDTSEALGPLVCAISTPEFQMKQVKDFISRLHTVMKIAPTGYQYTIADYFKSYLGQATALDQHINKPALVARDVADALNTFYKKNSNAPTNPNQWTTQQRSTYEREILQDYGVNRKMNDPKNRYEKLKMTLPLP